MAIDRLETRIAYSRGKWELSKDLLDDFPYFSNEIWEYIKMKND